MKQDVTAKNLSSRICCFLVVAVLGAAFAVPAAANDGAVAVHASCAGDIVSGTVRPGRSTPTGDLELLLLGRRSASSSFSPTGKHAWIRAGGGGSSRFSFDVGQLTAVAYRVDAPGGRGNVVPAASCAPGHQVPEAPMSLLLPVSVLGLVGVVFARRRRFRLDG